MRRSKARALVLVPYLLSLLILLPLHAGTLGGLDGCERAAATPLQAAPGHADPSQRTPGDQPFPRHNESTCTICAVGGHFLVVEVGALPADSTAIALVPVSLPCHTSPSLLAPRSPRAPPTATV